MAINLRNNVTGTGLNLVTNPILKSSATNPVNIGVKTPVNQYKSEDPRYANKTQVNTQVQTTAPMSVNPKYQTTTPVQTQTQVQTPVNNNQSRFIGFQAPTLQDSLNILQQRQQTQGNTTKKTTTAKTTKNNNYTYDQLVKAIQDFHYDVKNSDGKLTKQQISKKYPEFKGKEEEALRLQEALLPYVKDNEFAPIEGIQQNFPDLLQIQQQGQEKATGIEGLKQFGAGLKERFEAFGRGIDNLLSKGQSQVDGSGVDLNAYTKYIQEKYGVSYPAKLDKATRDKELEAVKNDPSLLAPYTTKTADDILDVAEGGVDIAFSTFNPVATAAFTTAGGLESMMGGGALTWFGEKMGGIGSVINELPGLKQLRDSLSEENKQRFDMFVANSALGLLMGTKNKQNIIKNPKQFLIENLQPNQISKNFMENVIGISDKAYSGVQRAGKFVKKIGEEKNIVTNGVKNADNVNLKGENIAKNADNTEVKAGEVKQGENKITETNNVTKNGGWSKGKVNESIISKGVDAISEGLGKIKQNIVEPITDAAATKITSTATPQDKLFQAVSPSLNRLTNKRDNYTAKRQNIERGNEIIIEYGYLPKNTTEYYVDVVKAKQDLWKEIQAGLDEHAKTTVNSKELTDYVREAMSDDAKYPLETNKADLAKLTKELDSLDEVGELSLERLEALKQQINAKLNWAKNPTAGEIYEKGLREMNKKISEMEDQMVSELPGELTKFKKDYGALKDMEEDVLKMMLKDMKRKSGGSLYQNRGRLEALGKITTAPLEATLQFMLGESLGKARDVDFLIEKGFKDLKDMYKGEKKTLQVKKAVTAKKDNVTAKKEEPKKEDMSKKEEKTNMKKEPEQKKEDSAHKEEKPEKKEDSMSDFVKEMEESSNIKEGEVSYKDISTRTLNKLYESEKTPKSEKAKIEKELEIREADMNGGAKDYDLLDHEYAYRINQLAEEEKRIGKVGKNDVNKAFKEKQSLELKKKVDRLREEMKEDYKDRFSSDAELDEHYNALRNKGINYINEYKLSKNYSTFKQEDELINSLNERWSKQPKFVRELTEEQQNVRESSIGDYKNDNYEIKTTDYQDSFSSKNNPKNKGAIYWGDNERVVVNRIETLKESGLLDKLPDDMKVEVSGEGEIGTIKDLKNLDSEGVLGGEPKTPRNVIGNGKNNATTRFQKGKKEKSHFTSDTTSVSKGSDSLSRDIINKKTEIARENGLNIDEKGNPYYKRGDRIITINPKKNHSFSGYKFKKREGSDEFSKELKDVREGKKTKTEITTIPEILSNDGKTKKLIIDTNMYEKNSVVHGVIDANNLLTVGNEYEHAVKMPNSDNHINLYKEIPGTDNYFLIGADKSRYNGEEFYTLTYHEPTKGLKKALEKDLASGKELFKRGEDGKLYPVKNNKTAVTGKKTNATDGELSARSKIRFQKSGKTTSKEFKDWFGDWENDPKNASKVVDKEGKPLEVYHGSYEGGFNIFDKKLRGSATNAKSAKLGFFFTDNESLAKEYSKRSADGQLYKVYLDMKNPLIRDFKGKNVNADKELTNLIKEAKSNWNDGVIAKNLKDGFRTDNQYVVFEPNQIKSATDNIGTFDKNNPDIRFQKGGKNNLIALHNTSIDKLDRSKKLGGLVAPSVAITKNGIPFENYGEISFIGSKKLVNPSDSVMVGETDLYSPRVPQPTLEWKEGVTREMKDKIAEKFGMRYSELADYVDGYSQNYYERTYPGLAEEVEPLINKTLFKGFTDMGDRIYEPYDMQHIIKDMFAEGTEGAESSMFQGSYNEAMARLSENVKDFEQVRGKIENKKGLEEKYKKLSDKRNDLGWDLLGGDNGMALFTENIKKSNSYIVNELADLGIEVTEKQVQQLKNLVQKGLQLPKTYVEAKIKRGVNFDEFDAVVVPEKDVAKVKEMLKDSNIDVYGYKEGERGKVIDQITEEKGLKFQKENNNLEKEYEKAVQEGNTEKAKEILQEYAEKNGYNKPEDYKGAGTWHAPSADFERSDFKNLDVMREAIEDGTDINLYAMGNKVYSIPENMLEHGAERRFWRSNDGTTEKSFNAIRKIMDDIENHGEGYDPEVTVYRAVPNDVKAGMLESGGEWITPAREYAEHHGLARFGEGEYKIIEEKVKASELWWDGNDINEWGFDDGKNYVTKPVKNSRKDLEITYDDNGNLIPLSERFNENIADTRYQKGENIGRSSFTEKSLNKAIENMKKTGLAKDVKTVDTVSDLRKELKGKISKSDLLQVDGEIAGCTTPDGTVYLVKEFLRDDTLKHEFAHRFRSYAEKNNPELFKAINKVAEEAPTELKERIKRDYGELSDDALLDEVFAWKQGEFKVTGAELKWYQKMWKAIEELWNSIKSKFGKNYADLSAFDGWEKMSSEQIMSRINDILENGKKVGKPKNLVTNKRLREQTVWHGSKANFDKFDSSHMGEGEGNQAHGWGHYVAVNEKTSRRYAELGKQENKISYKGQGIDGILNSIKENPENQGIWQLYTELKYMADKGESVNVEEIRDNIIKQYERDSEWAKSVIKEVDDKEKAKKAEGKRLGKSDKEYRDNIRKMLDMGEKKIQKLKEVKADDWGIEKSSNNLYNVEIPDPIKKDTPTGSNYLEEDGKIQYNQIEKLSEGLEKYDERGNWGKNAFLRSIISDIEDISGGWDDKLDKYVTKGHMSGRKLYKHLVDYFGGRERGEKKASKFLESLGYDGIHYYGGIDGEAYVIFNDDALKINSHTKRQKTKATGNSKNRVTSK